MEIENKYPSTLNMSELYVERFTFSHNKGIEDAKLPLAITKKIEQQVDNSVHVMLSCMVGNEITGIKLEITMSADFNISQSVTDESERLKLINQNTIAIMFPFMRSQITVLTSQPGLQPIIIPPVNVLAIMDE